MSDDTDMLTNIGTYSLYILFSSVMIVVMLMISHIYFGTKLTQILKKASISAKTAVSMAAASVEYSADAAESLISNDANAIGNVVDGVKTGIKGSIVVIQPITAAVGVVSNAISGVVGGINDVINPICGTINKLKHAKKAYDCPSGSFGDINIGIQGCYSCDKSDRNWNLSGKGNECGWLHKGDVHNWRKVSGPCPDDYSFFAGVVCLPN